MEDVDDDGDTAPRLVFVAFTLRAGRLTGKQNMKKKKLHFNG